LRWLDTKPIAESIEQLQGYVDELDFYYKTQRPHQGLPGRITPQQAWDATPVAEPPRPAEVPVEPVLPDPVRLVEMPIDPLDPHPTPRQARRPRGPLPEQGERLLPIARNGTIYLHGVTFPVSHPHAGRSIHVIWNPAGLPFIDDTGEVLAHHA
jgi:hypothetical protein